MKEKNEKRELNSMIALLRQTLQQHVCAVCVSVATCE